MKRQRHGRTGRMAGLCWILLVVAGPTLAQNAPGPLPADVVGAQGKFSSEQARLVDRYVDWWAERMIASDDPVAVAEAREALLEPFKRPTGDRNNEAFKDQYSADLITAIRPGADSEQLAIRLNTIIVVAESYGAYGVDLAVGRLNDRSASVRYWAAAAIGAAVRGTPSRPALEPARQRQIHEVIQGGLATEDACDVREKLYEALASMTIDAALETLIEALDERADHYARQGVGACLRAEKTGLTRLRRVLINAYLDASQPPRQQQRAKAAREHLRRLSIVTYRYVSLVAREVSDGDLAADTRAIAGDIVGLGQLVLRETLDAYDGEEQAGPNFEQPFEAGESIQFAWAVNEWADVMKDEPMSVPANMLQLPQPRQRQMQPDGETGAPDAPPGDETDDEAAAG